MRFSGRCVHCLREIEEVEGDHLPPEAWYPKSTPANFPKPQIPSCRECNGRYGKIEDDFLTRLALCLDPHSSSAEGLPERALRAINPSKARSERDRGHRQARRSKLRRQTFVASEFPRSAFLPDLEIPAGAEGPTPLVVGIPAASIEAIGEKFARGITFLLQGLYIDTTHTIRTLVLSENQSAEIKRVVRSAGVELPCGPGFQLRKTVAQDDPVSGLFEIVLWNRLPIYATVRGSD